MSRLNSMIRRLIAQRDILDHIASDLNIPSQGPILELGLGNGRTYSHLRERFPDRRIIAFDHVIAAHRSSIPDQADMVLGDIAETAQAFVGQNAALVHADIGTAYPDSDVEVMAWLPDLTVGLLAPGGICASGLKLENASLSELPLPHGIAPGRYFLYARA